MAGPEEGKCSGAEGPTEESEGVQKVNRGFQRRGGTDISGRSIEIPAILSPSELSRALDRKEIPSKNS